MNTTEFTARLSFEGFFYTAQCLEVDISAEGDTQEKAIENLRTQLMLQLRIPSASIALECGYLPEISVSQPIHGEAFIEVLADGPMRAVTLFVSGDLKLSILLNFRRGAGLVPSYKVTERGVRVLATPMLDDAIREYNIRLSTDPAKRIGKDVPVP
jgi:hypothetical protein